MVVVGSHVSPTVRVRTYKVLRAANRWASRHAKEQGLNAGGSASLLLMVGRGMSLDIFVTCCRNLTNLQSTSTLNTTHVRDINWTVTPPTRSRRTRFPKDEMTLRNSLCNGDKIQDEVLVSRIGSTCPCHIFTQPGQVPLQPVGRQPAYPGTHSCRATAPKREALSPQRLEARPLTEIQQGLMGRKIGIKIIF